MTQPLYELCLICLGAAVALAIVAAWRLWKG